MKIYGIFVSRIQYSEYRGERERDRVRVKMCYANDVCLLKREYGCGG